MKPSVSIITPAYRAEPWIARAVRSVQAQTRDDWEMVVVADDHTDYQKCLEEEGIKDTRLRFVRTGGVGMGIARARNVGMQAASADIMAMLDADDEFAPVKLERMVPLATEHGFCVSVLDYVRYVEGKRQPIHLIGKREADGLLGPADYLNAHYSANAMMVFDRKRMPESWREDVPAMEDMIFSMSAFSHLPAIYHVNEPLHVYVYTENSFSTAPEATGRFIAAKTAILSRIDEGGLGIIHPDAVAAFRRFNEVSLATEKEYAAARQRGETVTFTELLKRNLFSDW